MIKFRRIITSALMLFISSFATAEPIDLIDAYELALNHDAEIRVAYHQLMASKEVKPQALADLLPSIDASASSKDSREKTDSSLGKGITKFKDESFTLSLRQPLFNLQRFLRFSQAQKTVSRAEVEYQLANQDLILRLTQQYLDTLQATVSLDVSNEDLIAFEKRLEHSKLRFKAGLVPITDVHEAQSRYDIAAATQISAKDSLQSQQEALREIIQVESVDITPFPEEFHLETPQPNVSNKWESVAKTHNLSIKVAQLNVKIAKDEVKTKQSSHYPTIDFVASHSYNETGTNHFSTEADTIGVEFNMPLFSGGKTLSATRQAAFNHKKAQSTLQLVQRTSLRETRDAFRGVNASILRIKALEKAIISNKNSLEAIEASLAVGTRTTVDVLDAQGNLSRAKLQLIAEKNNYILNVLTLKSTSGSLSKEDLSKVNQWIKTPNI